MVQETVLLEGHLIDSDILKKVFDRVVEEGGAFEVLEFRVGRTNAEPSSARVAGKAPEPPLLHPIFHGRAHPRAPPPEMGGARVAPAAAPRGPPPAFSSPPHLRTPAPAGRAP